jgi:hypothetical protein
MDSTQQRLEKARAEVKYLEQELEIEDYVKQGVISVSVAVKTTGAGYNRTFTKPQDAIIYCEKLNEKIKQTPTERPSFNHVDGPFRGVTY